VVPEDGVTAPLEAVLRDDGAALDVKIRAEKDLQHATVVIVREGEARNAEIRTVWDSMEVTFDALAPGNYQVFAFDSVEDLNYADPGVLAKYSAKAGKITLAPNGNGSLTLDLIHAEE
jgi:protein involved in temperature-dependent protein secretion